MISLQPTKVVTTAPPAPILTPVTQGSEGKEKGKSKGKPKSEEVSSQSHRTKDSRDTSKLPEGRVEITVCFFLLCNN
jgi:hypothetical protein